VTGNQNIVTRNNVNLGVDSSGTANAIGAVVGFLGAATNTNPEANIFA
jgi:hypothetical protein